jgi:integrase
MKFTTTAIKKLKAKEIRYEVFEDGRPGFGIRVAPSGRKSWLWLYRYQGRSRRMTLGTFPQLGLHEAHLKHAEAKRLLSMGIDAGASELARKESERRASTVAVLADEYLTRHAMPNKKSWKEDRRILNKDVLPAWGKRKAKDITRRNVIALLDGIRDRGAPIAANRALALVKRLFRFAVERDILDTSPVVAIRAAKESPRDRMLTESELTTLVQGLEAAKGAPLAKLALKFQLLTAQRKGEVMAAEWVHMEGDSWTLPATHTKNGKAHVIPLSPQALKVLEAIKALSSNSPFLFSGKGTNGRMTIHTLDRLLRCNNYFGLPRFTPHDLRRTAASHMTALGIPRLVVAKILNHSDTAVTAIYDRHSYTEEKRNALEIWARKVEALGNSLPKKKASEVSLALP